MPPILTTTSDISNRTKGYFVRELLKRAQPLLVFNKLGTPRPLPKHVGKTITFRGYLPLPTTPKTLIEGVTPDASKPTYREVEAIINQYGDHIRITDVLPDVHEDPLIAEFSDILSEQAAIMLERVTLGVLNAGTNVVFSGETGGVIAAGRNEVNKPLTLNLQRLVTRTLKRQEARYLRQVISSSPNFNTSPIEAAYIAVTHTDLEATIRDLPGFVPTVKYGQRQPMDGEIGSVEDVRYVLTNIPEPWVDAGAPPLAGDSMESTSGACCDVYPIYYIAKDAYNVIPFARAKGGTPPIDLMVLQPNVARGGDPLGQRGSIGWKAMHTAAITYDFYMVRAEVAVPRLRG